MNVTLLLVLTLAVVPNADQRRKAGAAEEPTVKTEIALKLGPAASYAFSGQAVCQHLAKGSIYDTVAERWSVIHRDGERSLNFTLWRPLAGGQDMTTFDATVSGERYQVNTVKTPQGSIKGAATVTFAPSGKGGMFTISGTSGSGAKISGTIRCEAFTTPEAVAGN